VRPPGYERGPIPPGVLGPAVAPPAPPGAGRWLLASWGRRALAGLLDLVVVVALAVGIVAVFGAVFSAGFLGGDTAGVISVVVGLLLSLVAVVCAAALYAPTVMAATDGRTLGKAVCGIRVVRTSGSRMGFWWSVLREVVFKGFVLLVLASVTFGLAILADLLWPLWDGEQRALHDFPCQTRVVRG